MAQATLSDRSGLANSGRFQSRVQSAIKKKAAYWLNPAQDPSTVGGFNLKLQKQRRFAKQVLGSYYQQLQPFCEYFMSQYNEDLASENLSNPDVTGAGNRLEDQGSAFDINSNQLADFELTDSGAIDLAFDYFAGVEEGDDTESILW